MAVTTKHLNVHEQRNCTTCGNRMPRRRAAHQPKRICSSCVKRAKGMVPVTQTDHQAKKVRRYWA